MKTSKKITIKYAGHTWTSNGLYTMRDAVAGSKDDTSSGRVGVHHYYPYGTSYDDNSIGGRALVLSAISKLSARERWYDRATETRQLAQVSIISQPHNVIDDLLCSICGSVCYGDCEV